MTYRKRAFTALVAGALALPLLASPALAAHGGPQAGPAQSIDDFCENPFPEVFTDVNATDVFARAIQCIATAGRETASPTNANGDPITVGGPEGIPSNQYGPNRGVLRGQMASFIARMLDAAERRDREEVPGPGRIQALPAYDGSNEFTDVPNNFVHVQNINRLADANIVLGGPNGRPRNIYAPNDFISRAQMASFINRAAAYALFQDPNNSGRGTGYTTTSNFFVDSGEIGVHQANINGLASVGVVIGVQPESAHRYAPRSNVTRAQMAGFISRNLAELFDRDRIHSLLEVFTGNFTADSREDRDEATNSRTYEARALVPGQEYRVTLVRCDNVDRGADDLVTFDRDGEFADARGTTATIAGGANSSPNSAVFTPGADGVVRFAVTSDADECVRPVLYINGGPGQSLQEGGDSPRLQVDAEGHPIEFFGVAGAVTFLGEDEEVAGEADVELATDTAAPGDSVMATVTANQPIASVLVTGDCVEDQTFTPGAGDDDQNFGFDIEIAADAAEGECVLTFTTTFENGTTDTDTETITIVAEDGEAVQGQAEVELATDTAAPGDSVMATVTADQPITSVLVTGDCVEDQTFTPGAGDDDQNFGFDIEIAADADEGDCVLTFTTTFENGTTDTDTETITIVTAPTISDARVATDAAMGTGNAMATDTASEGDFFELTLSESVATNGATATFEDSDGDSFTIECTDGGGVTIGNTPATCTLVADGDGFLLTIELLSDPIVTGTGNGVADFPLEIVETDGFTDSDGNEIDLARSDDTAVERDDMTNDAVDPSP